MRFLINIISSLYMILQSRSIGNNVKDIFKLIRFLSSNKKKVLVLETAELDTNVMVKDLKKYIRKYGPDIGIVRDVKLVQTKQGTMRFTKLTLYKGNNNRQDLLYLALQPYLKEYNDKIISIGEYKHRKIQAVAI